MAGVVCAVMPCLELGTAPSCCSVLPVLSCPSRVVLLPLSVACCGWGSAVVMAVGDSPCVGVLSWHDRCG